MFYLIEEKSGSLSGGGFDEFKAKYDKAPYTEEQKELMELFNEEPGTKSYPVF